MPEWIHILLSLLIGGGGYVFWFIYSRRNLIDSLRRDFAILLICVYAMFAPARELVWELAVYAKRFLVNHEPCEAQPCAESVKP
jgi:hypothetical protein